MQVKSESLEGYEIAQQYFRNPKVKHIEQIPRGEVDVEGLKDFLVVQNNFAEERVNKIIERLIKAKTKKAQLSLNSFFGSPVAPKPQTTEPRRTEDKQDTPAKRDLKAISADENSCTKDVIQAVETKRVDRPVIGIAAVCPSNVRLVKKRHKRWFGTSKCERRVEKPVPIEVDETAVPPHLQRFICVRHFEPRVTIKRTNPREVDSASVDNLVTHLCKRYGINTDTVANAEKEVSAGGEGPLWPNPLLKRFRASTSGYCKPRLQELWRSSSSHGISWDAFDKLYITFREARDANAAEWDKHAPDIADFASKVAREKIIKWCNSTESCPPRLLRKWTHLLYTRWRERYMHVYGPRMLSRYLKGEVTDRVLMREINECTAPGVICSQSPFSTEASGHNPHFVHRVVRDEPANE
ncbi:Flap endonuclease 1 [Babesia sp. Xinjiang]|uniref:Flap endonuclease 1 n=1 Tax=Babesia sp. Xinjiang TaxID=462227 RepID=UPI000A25177A|nr:Flap endonuclease 1 [Babesia sp. Xinjiang]ORM42038.1 Flap endonuclease 1 [Babesia sp. Xinjiang]